MTASLENRQHLSADNEQERIRREADTRQLIDDMVGRSNEFFTEPQNRLEFIQSQDSDSFYRIVQHANARLRGENSAELRRDPNENGAFLPTLHTPSREDKIPAFKRGYQAIQEYIANSSDPVDKKITNVAMATEALVIWTHPFNDGNGRTSRFIATLIEDGTSDVDSLVEQTASRIQRGRVYNQKFPTKESMLETANNEDIMLDDDERSTMRLEAQSLPNDIEGMYKNIQHLLHVESADQNLLQQDASARQVA